MANDLKFTASELVVITNALWDSIRKLNSKEADLTDLERICDRSRIINKIKDHVSMEETET